MKRTILFMILLTIMVTISIPAMAFAPKKDKKAIVIASFGTTYPTTLKAITDIQKEVQKLYPTVQVRLAFTSNIIRKIWHKRRDDPQYLKDPRVPKEVLMVKGPLATIADLQDEGYRTIIVQPTHIYAGEEFQDLTSYINGLNSIRTLKPKYLPFNKLIIGRPLLGKPGPQHDYHEDMTISAKALSPDIDLARQKKAALVYMGHGNEFYSTGAYIEFQQVLRRMYPEVPIFIGTVEGFPSLDDVLAGLRHYRVKRVLLKPFMIVAGDHANNDMAGPDKDSWKNRIESLGIHVTAVLRGIGENPAIAKIFAQHVRDAAKDSGCRL